MSLNPADEPPIDTSLGYYMEGRALSIALEKASGPAERARIEHLVELRHALMQRRESFHNEATAKRHARGEIYSKARVAAINSIGPAKSDMERDAERLYSRQLGSDEILKAHARIHYAHALMSSRLLLASSTPDVVDAARAMQRYEEGFASEWVDAITDTTFKPALMQLQREALRLLRTSTRPMYLLSQPPLREFDDIDAQGLGKAWNKLDELAQTLGVDRLSNFIAVPNEGDSAFIPAAQLLPSVSAIVEAVQMPGQKIPSKRATISSLIKVRDELQRLSHCNGKACFEIDV